VTALNTVQKSDWATFLRSRLDAHAPPLDGLAASGWKIVYTDKPSDFETARDKNRKEQDFTWSIGLTLSAKDDQITDVRWHGPAFKAGLAPGGMLVAVNGHAFKPELLSDAITAAKSGGAPIALLIKDQDEFKTIAVDYHDGLRYPHLEAVAGATDYLTQIIAPRK
jgi:predicted metalloprotease with PDZ domain